MRAYTCVWPHLSETDGAGRDVFFTQNTLKIIIFRNDQPQRHISFAQNTLKLFFKEKQDHDTVHICILSNMDNQHICTSRGLMWSLIELRVLRPILRALFFKR